MEIIDWKRGVNKQSIQRYGCDRQPQNFEVLALAILEVVEFLFVVYLVLSKFACKASRVKCMKKQPEYGSFRSQRSMNKKAFRVAQ